MTKLKPYSRNLVKRGLLLLNLFIISCLISSCSYSTTPTYLKENIDEAVKDICRNEYKLDVKTKLVGSTLWIYLPLENIVVKSDKPEKYVERFLIENNKTDLQKEVLKIEYLIRPIKEQEKYQDLNYDKKVMERINNIWQALRRVLFSMEESKRGGPQFFCLVVADIKNGFQIKEVFYYLDIKKVSYGFISRDEYQHRTIQDTEVLPGIVGDKEGLHLNYRDISLEEFIVAQIQHRIRLKFQRPEIGKNADIDKEILKIIVYTIKTYEFKDFSSVELNNLFTNNKIVLNQAAIWARPIEQKS
jgi:hypothetical protein